MPTTDEKVIVLTASLSRHDLLRSSVVGGLGIMIVGSVEAIVGSCRRAHPRPDGRVRPAGA